MSRILKTVIIFSFALLGLWSGDSVLSAQCPMVCRQNFTVSLGANGQAELDADIVLDSSTDGCTQGFNIEIIDTYSATVYGNTATAQMIGANLIFKVTDNATGNNCDGILVVLDNTPPQIVTDTLVLDCNAETDPEIIGFPVATDNVSTANMLDYDWFDDFIDYNCFTIVDGIPVTAEIIRTWYVSDQYGNIRQADQHILLKRNTLTEVVWPPNRDGFAAPYLACNTDDPNDLNLTGEPSINGKVIHGGSDCDLLTSYTDQTTTICGGETKIFRSWTVFDYCTDESEVYIQLIRVKDTEAPTLTCPADITVGTDTGFCSGEVHLPFATADDNCSGYTISHTWDFGTDQGVYEDVPVGGYTVTYTARDECGNEGFCEVDVLVIDDEEPTPVCKEHTFISLSDAGTDFLGAHTFNENSIDNCSVDRFEVSRNGIDFHAGLTFDCNDIPASPMSLILRVYDHAGYFNDCEVEVTIEDFLSPVLTCPIAVVLDCFDDINNLNISGLASVYDNCDMANISHVDDNSNLNSCGFGTVLRLYTAEDASGNTASCVQQINIGDATPTGVNFPPDFTTYDCSLTLDPVTTGTPELTGVDCEQMLVFHVDDTISTSDACMHIQRFWEIYDECIFDPNNSANDGYWSYFQTLKIYDNDAPELQIPDDITMFITGDNCEVYVAFPDATATDCSPLVSITNNSFFSDSNVENASGTYPQGFHYITFTARDECDNIVNESVQLTVLDNEIPTVNCNGGFTVNLGASGTASVDPQLFDAGSYDNCSTSLTYLLTPSEFNCEDRGEKDVLFQVRDESGNEGSCWTTLTIQDNNNVCANADIAGTITNQEGETIGGKYVGLSGTIQMAISTNPDGTFEFPNLPSGEYYELKPTYNLNLVNGVTTNDIIFIRRHILNSNPFTSPYTLIAADVNNSGAVTTSDIVMLRKAILNSIDEFPTNQSWRFVAADYEFPNPLNPFLEEFPEEIIIPVLTQNYLENDFIAIKIGDVNGSANFSGNGGEERSRVVNGELPIYTQNLTLESGFDYKVPFQVKDLTDIFGLQFELDFDPNALIFKSIEFEDLPEIKAANFGTSRSSEGKITFSWDTFLDLDLPEDLRLFSLHFTANEGGELKDFLQINTKRIQAEAYRGAFLDRDNFELLDVKLNYQDAAIVRARLEQNFPNPTNGKTTIGFYLADASEVTLSVFDTYGKIIWQDKNSYGHGDHEVEVRLPYDNLKPGLYYYQISGKGFRNITRKMMVTR